MQTIKLDSNKLFKDSLRLEIVTSQCFNQLEKAQTFEMEQLHVILNTIGDIKRCLFYKYIDPLKTFEPYMQIMPSRLDGDKINFKQDSQPNEQDKYVRFGEEIVFQLPLFGIQNKCIGKMQIFFKTQKSLQDRVKIECIEKLQCCLNSIGNFCSSIEKLIVTQYVPLEEGAVQTSNGQDLSIVINVNDSFLANNIEVQTYLEDKQKQINEQLKATEAIICFYNFSTEQIISIKTEKESPFKRKSDIVTVLNNKLKSSIKIQNLNEFDINTQAQIQLCIEQKLFIKKLNNMKFSLFPITSSYNNLMGFVMLEGESIDSSTNILIDETYEIASIIELMMLKQHSVAEAYELEYIGKIHTRQTSLKHSPGQSIDKMTYISNLKSDGSSSLELLDVKIGTQEANGDGGNIPKLESSERQEHLFEASKNSKQEEIIDLNTFSNALSAIKESDHEYSAVLDSFDQKSSIIEHKNGKKVIQYKNIPTRKSRCSSRNTQTTGQKSTKQKSAGRNSNNAVEDNRIFIESQSKSENATGQKSIKKNAKHTKKLKAQLKLQNSTKSEEVAIKNEDILKYSQELFDFEKGHTNKINADTGIANTKRTTEQQKYAQKLLKQQKNNTEKQINQLNSLQNPEILLESETQQNIQQNMDIFEGSCADNAPSSNEDIKIDPSTIKEVTLNNLDPLRPLDTYMAEFLACHNKEKTKTQDDLIKQLKSQIQSNQEGSSDQQILSKTQLDAINSYIMIITEQENKEKNTLLELQKILGQQNLPPSLINSENKNHIQAKQEVQKTPNSRDQFLNKSLKQPKGEKHKQQIKQKVTSIKESPYSNQKLNMPHKVQSKAENSTASAFSSGVLSETINQFVVRDIQSVQAKLKTGAEKYFGKTTNQMQPSSKPTIDTKQIKTKRESLIYPNYIDSSNQISAGGLSVPTSPNPGFPNNHTTSKNTIRFRSKKLSNITQQDLDNQLLGSSLVQIGENNEQEHFRSEYVGKNELQAEKAINGIKGQQKHQTNQMLTEEIQNIFENSNMISFDESQQPFIKKFDDSIDQFIKILKKTTSAFQINIYSKELIQIYTDYSSKQEDRVRNLKQLHKFLQEVFQDDSELLRSKNLKKYTIPQNSCFKNIKSAELLKDAEYSHGGEVFDLLLAKIALDDTDLTTKDNFIICECFFNARYISYYPEMFINICQNFLTADLQLKKDIQLLLQISQSVQNQPHIQSNEAEQLTSNGGRFKYKNSTELGGLSTSLLELPGYQGENDGEDEPVNDEYTQYTETVGGYSQMVSMTQAATKGFNQDFSAIRQFNLTPTHTNRIEDTENKQKQNKYPSLSQRQSLVMQNFSGSSNNNQPIKTQDIDSTINTNTNHNHKLELLHVEEEQKTTYNNSIDQIDKSKMVTIVHHSKQNTKTPSFSNQFIQTTANNPKQAASLITSSIDLSRPSHQNRAKAPQIESLISNQNDMIKQQQLTNQGQQKNSNSQQRILQNGKQNENISLKSPVSIRQSANRSNMLNKSGSSNGRHIKTSSSIEKIRSGLSQLQHTRKQSSLAQSSNNIATLKKLESQQSRDSSTRVGSHKMNNYSFGNMQEGFSMARSPTKQMKVIPAKSAKAQHEKQKF